MSETTAPPASTAADGETRIWFEDLAVGQEWRTGRRTVTEADVTAFAGISGDFNPIHVDAVYAEQSPFGERIAHGALIIAIATGLRQQDGRFHGSLKAWTGISDWRFRAPVRIGDTVHVVNRVAELAAARRPEDGRLTQDVEVRNQRDEIVASGQFVTLMRRRRHS